jgi:hypothetical protein
MMLCAGTDAATVGTIMRWVCPIIQKILRSIDHDSPIAIWELRRTLLKMRRVVALRQSCMMHCMCNAAAKIRARWNRSSDSSIDSNLCIISH